LVDPNGLIEIVIGHPLGKDLILLPFCTCWLNSTTHFGWRCSHRRAAKPPPPVEGRGGGQSTEKTIFIEAAR
jgi:hypothetical protein